MTHPIAFFAYKRHEHTRNALIALQNNSGFDPSLLHVFCDGARKPQDVPFVERTRKIIRDTVSSETTIVCRTENWGLSKSIIAGTDALTKQYGTVIVLEDDLITSPQFLSYMTRGLDLYAQNEQVMQISGHMFPTSIPSKDDAVFLPFSTSWGWATWKRAWDHFDPDMTQLRLLDEDRRLRRRFDLNGSFPYYKMACKQRRGKIDSWAIRWYLSMFFRNGLALYPRHTLVSNTGFDGTGVHCPSSHEAQELRDTVLNQFPDVKVDPQVQAAVFRHLKRRSRLSYKLFTRVRARFFGS